MTLVLSIAYEKTPLKLALGTPSRVSVGAVVIGGPGPTGPTGPTGATGPTGPASSWGVIPDKPANITSIAGLTGAADKVLTSTGVGTFVLVPMTAAGRAIIDDADAAAQRTTLGLGTAATLNTGTSSGNIPVLGAGGLLDTAVLPSVAITDVFVVASQAAMLALTAQKGDIAVRTDINKSFALSTNSPGALADWKELLTPTGAVLSVAGLTGAISASALRTALSLVVGTDVQEYSAILAAVAGLTGAANDDVVQKKSGAFTNRTPAQLLADIVASALGTVTIPGTSSTAAGVRLAEDTDNGTNYIGLRAPSSVSANKEFILPGVDGYAGDALVTDGAGNFSFSPRAIPDPTEFTTVRPTLDLDFTNINGAPFAGNLTRSTAGGYRMNSKGVLVPTVANEPMIEFGADGVARGTGVYPAYTNLLTYSEQFENAAWSKEQATVTANASSAPDGASTADRVLETATTGLHTVRRLNVASLTGAKTTYAVFVRRLATGTGRNAYIQFENFDTVTSAYVKFDLAAGAILAQDAGLSHAGIESLRDGWFRVWATVDSPDTDNSNIIKLGIMSGASTVSYAGDTSSGLDVWGAQLTQTAIPVPYAPTTSATVTRNADSMVISGASFTDFVNLNEGTMYAEFIRPPASAGTCYYYQIGTGTTNRILGACSSTGTIVHFMVSSSTNQAVLASGVVADGAVVKTAFAWAKDSFVAATLGVATSYDTAGTVATGLDSLYVGAGGSVFLNSPLCRLIYWPKALAAADLERMTA